MSEGGKRHDSSVNSKYCARTGLALDGGRVKVDGIGMPGGLAGSNHVIG
jgi:hypothetical protein